MNRSLPVVAALVILAILIGVLMGRPGGSTPANPATTQETSVISPAPSSPTGTESSGPDGSKRVNLSIEPLTLEGVVDLGPETPADRIAVRVGEVTIADVPVIGGDYSVTLPGKLENMPLASLETVELPNGNGRLKGQNALGAPVTFIAYQDENQDGKLDAGEPSAEGTPFKGTLQPGMRGFFRYRTILVSAPAELRETQDSATGAKGFYRYDLKLTAGWHVLEGEFASNGYDIREAKGQRWDLTLPIVPKKGPSTLER